MTYSSNVVPIHPAQPFPLANLSLCFSTTRQVWDLLDPEFDAYIQKWFVQAFSRDEDGNQVKEVATAELWVYDALMAAYGGEDITDLLDSDSADAHAYSVLFEDDEFHPDLDVSGGGIKLLILDRVVVAEPYRGHGIGPLVAALSLKELRAGCGVAACYPAPIEGEFEGSARNEEVARLSGIWSKVGFEHFRDGVWVIDLGLKTLDDVVDNMLGSLR